MSDNPEFGQTYVESTMLVDPFRDAVYRRACPVPGTCTRLLLVRSSFSKAPMCLRRS